MATIEPDEVYEPGREVVRHTDPDNEPVLNLGMLSEQAIQAAERAVAHVNRIKGIALRVTNELDWHDLGGKPYLNEGGAMKVASLFGVSFTGTRVEERTDTHDGAQVITYIAHVTAEFNGRRMECEGLATSEDDFFKFRWKDGTRVTLPLSERNLSALRKKAVTNAMNRALKKILGLGNLTWDDVKGGNVDRNKMTAAEYRKPAANGAPPSGAPATKSSGHVRLKQLLGELTAFTGRDEADLLREYTSFQGKDGKTTAARSVDSMSVPWVSRTLPKVEAAVANLSPEPGSEEPQ